MKFDGGNDKTLIIFYLTHTHKNYATNQYMKRSLAMMLRQSGDEENSSFIKYANCTLVVASHNLLKQIKASKNRRRKRNEWDEDEGRRKGSIFIL